MLQLTWDSCGSSLSFFLTTTARFFLTLVSVSVLCCCIAGVSCSRYIRARRYQRMMRVRGPVRWAGHAEIIGRRHNVMCACAQCSRTGVRSSDVRKKPSPFDLLLHTQAFQNQDFPIPIRIVLPAPAPAGLSPSVVSSLPVVRYKSGGMGIAPSPSGRANNAARTMSPRSGAGSGSSHVDLDGAAAAAAADAGSSEPPLSPSQFTCDSCVICLVDFSDGDDVMQLPCRHLFHPACIRPWFTQHTVGLKRGCVSIRLVCVCVVHAAQVAVVGYVGGCVVFGVAPAGLSRVQADFGAIHRVISWRSVALWLFLCTVVVRLGN